MGWKEDLILRPFYVSGNTLVIVNRNNRVTALFLNTPITQRQPTLQRTTNVTEINKRALGSKYLSGNNLPRISVWSVARCSQTSIYTLLPPVDFSCVCCCQSRWLARGNRCAERHIRFSYFDEFEFLVRLFLMVPAVLDWIYFFLYEVLKFVEMLRPVSRSLWSFILYILIFYDFFFFLFSSGEPGLVDRVLALHAGSRGFDSHRGHMS